MQAYKDAMKVALPVKVPKSKEEKKEEAARRQEDIDKYKKGTKEFREQVDAETKRKQQENARASVDKKASV